MGVKGEAVGACDWSSNICRQSKSSFTFPNKKNDGPMDREHLVQVGKLIEAAEINLRSNVKEVGHLCFVVSPLSFSLPLVQWFSSSSLSLSLSLCLYVSLSLCLSVSLSYPVFLENRAIEFSVFLHVS